MDMIVNDYLDYVQQARIFLLTVQTNEEMDETLAEISRLIKGDVTTYNVERLKELVDKLKRGIDAK